MPPSPAYKLTDFVSACGVASHVTVSLDALETAKTLQLHTERELLDWIAAGGVEKSSHANTEKWVKNPRPHIVVMVDSYDFYAGTTYLYLAFMYIPWMKRWRLKSLKPNDKPSSRAFVMHAQLSKIKLIAAK